jgi:hypothetical protein
MAFALTSFTADGIRYMGPGPYKAVQRYILTITGTTSDVDLDIGDLTGTFWTAAQADATYGAMATAVLAVLTANYPNYQAVENIFVPEIWARANAAAASGTVYVRSINSTTLLPEFTFAASNGATGYTVCVDYILKDGYLPLNYASNVQIGV